LDATQSTSLAKLQTVGFGSIDLADTVLQSDWRGISQLRPPRMVLA